MRLVYVALAVAVAPSSLSATTPVLLENQFGYAVAVWQDTAIVGSPGDNIGAVEDAGSVYVFVKTDGAWTERQKLTASDPASGALFGLSVALSGDTALVAAPGGTTLGAAAGAVYVFVRDGDVWVEQQKLTAPDAEAIDTFGVSIALAGDLALIGASRSDSGPVTDAGAAYVFARQGDTWNLEQKLTASDGAENDYFGGHVALSGDIALIGAAADDTAAGTDAGSAYVFVRAGGAWSEQQKLAALDSDSGQRFFGQALALAGDVAFVSARYGSYPPGSGNGAVYVFTGSGGDWIETQRLTAPDPQGPFAFGEAIALSGDTAVIGAPYVDGGAQTNADAAYVFRLGADAWAVQQALTAPVGGSADSFARAVALEGDTAFVSAHGDDVFGNDAGAVHVFARNAGAWSHGQTLRAGDAAPPPGRGGGAFGAGALMLLVVAGWCRRAWYVHRPTGHGAHSGDTVVLRLPASTRAGATVAMVVWIRAQVVLPGGRPPQRANTPS